MGCHMFNPETDGISLLADGLALVYHEARYARRIVNSGHLVPDGWEQLLTLPIDRVEAWRSILAVRQAASGQQTATQATALFERCFSKSVADLQRLYALPNWHHAGTVGGPAWRQVTAAVAELSIAIGTKKGPAIETAALKALASRHNNGPVRWKVRGLDTAIGVRTGPWWEE